MDHQNILPLCQIPHICGSENPTLHQTLQICSSGNPILHHTHFSLPTMHQSTLPQPDLTAFRIKSKELLHYINEFKLDA